MTGIKLWQLIIASLSFVVTKNLWQQTCHLHPRLWLWNMDPACWLKKRIQALETKCTRKLLHISCLQQPLLATVKRQKLGSGMSHAMMASAKPSFRAPRRVGDAMGSRGNAGWTTSKSGHPCPCQNCSKKPPAKKTGRGSLPNCPSCPHDNPISQETELNFLLSILGKHSELDVKRDAVINYAILEKTGAGYSILW